MDLEKNGENHLEGACEKRGGAEETGRRTKSESYHLEEKGKVDRPCDETEGMLRTVIEGREEGKRSRGRMRTTMSDDIKQGHNYHVIKNEALIEKRGGRWFW